MTEPTNAGVGFDGSIVLVGGASGGVGSAAARLLLRRGARVALHYRRPNRAIDELVQTFGDDIAFPVQADLTDRAAVETMVATTVDRFGRLDGFLNTTGGALRIQRFDQLDDTMIDETIAVELRSVITSAQVVLPHLLGGGRMVFVGSDSGKVGSTGEAVSAACRGGLIAFAKSLAREYARHGVLVNVVCPGPTDTGLWKDLVTNDEFGGKIGGAMVRAVPLRRLATASEIAAAAVFLLSPDASFITGQALSVSGGLTMS